MVLNESNQPEVKIKDRKEETHVLQKNHLVLH